MAMPPDIVDPAMLAQHRQALLVQQALQLLARGERERPSLWLGRRSWATSPCRRPNSSPARWQITMTAKAESVTINAVGLSSDARTQEARALARRSRWQTVGVEAELPEAADGEIRLQMELPHGVDGAVLATHLPASADWALLAAVLAQAERSRRGASSGRTYASAAVRLAQRGRAVERPSANLTVRP